MVSISKAESMKKTFQEKSLFFKLEHSHLVGDGLTGNESIRTARTHS
jgi:hypothetical protein